MCSRDIYHVLKLFLTPRASLVAQMVKRPGFYPWVGQFSWRRAWQPTPVCLPGESPWTDGPGGQQSMGSQRVRHNWVTKHTLGKAIGESFPMDGNSKMRIVGRLKEKARPCLDHIFPILEVRRPPWPHILRKFHWRPKGSDAKGCSLPICLFSKIHLG